MSLTDKQIYDLNNMNVAAQNVKLGDVLSANSGGMPYQQLVTDGEGNTKWEDRLMWKEVQEVDFVPEITFEMTETMMGLECIGARSLVAGNTYKYIVNGVEREGVAQILKSFGNYPVIVDPSTTLHIAPVTDAVIFASVTKGTYTVRVYGDNTFYHTIPIDYQESEIYIADIIQPDRDYVLENCTYEDIFAALRAGKLVFLRDANNILYPCISGKNVIDGQKLVFYLIFNIYVDEEDSEIRFKRYTIGPDNTISYAYRSLSGGKSIILASSTSGSSKKFNITVDDSGTIFATEATS